MLTGCNGVAGCEVWWFPMGVQGGAWRHGAGGVVKEYDSKVHDENVVEVKCGYISFNFGVTK